MQLLLSLFLVATFDNAMVAHSDGSIKVTCDEFCYFPNGDAERTWTCHGPQPRDNERCMCPGKLRSISTIAQKLFQ